MRLFQQRREVLSFKTANILLFQQQGFYSEKPSEAWYSLSPGTGAPLAGNGAKKQLLT